MKGKESKYNPATVKLICDAIEETGRDTDGFMAGDITKVTFYRWIREKPEFKAAVETARKVYKETSLPQLRKYARGGLMRTLQAVAEGREIITVTTTTGIGPEGEIDTETIKRQPAMVPVSQAFQFVMGKEIDLVSWLRQGVNLGVFPRSFVEAMIDDIDGVTARIREAVEGRITGGKTIDRNPGIDPSVAIAAALGLSDPTAVSKTVDSRQKPPKNMGKVKADRR